MEEVSNVIKGIRVTVSFIFLIYIFFSLKREMWKSHPVDKYHVSGDYI